MSNQILHFLKFVQLVFFVMHFCRLATMTNGIRSYTVTTAYRASSSFAAFSSSNPNQPSSPNRLSTSTKTTNTLHSPTDIGKNLILFQSHFRSRNSPSAERNLLKIAAINEERVSLITQRDFSLNKKKTISKEIGALMRDADADKHHADKHQAQIDEFKETVATENQLVQDLQDKLELVDNEVKALVLSLPNLLDDKVPEGVDDKDNVVVSTFGDVALLPKKLNWSESFTPLWHDDVATKLNGWESARAVKMSGSRFVALSGKIATLERAIGMFFLDLHTTKHGYKEVSVPLVVSRSSLTGTGQLPKFEDDLFAIGRESHTCNGEDAFLIPTAEVPVTNMHRDEILEEADLPIKYVSLTPCFRAEAGSSGKDTRGLIRTHQFSKVELVKITSQETSAEEHENLVRDAERCLELLGLPYRRVLLCAGDIGFGANLCYDLEVWLPGQGEWREISSCSNTGDFQARRMGLRYYKENDNDNDKENEEKKEKKKKKAKSKAVACHTINGSGLAVGRTLVAILENYQMEGGGLTIPEVLRGYMGGVETI